MREVEEKLKTITGYLLSIKRNTVSGWYELEIGLPNKWIFNENEAIGCEIINESDSGKLVKIFPKNNNVIIDELIQFVSIIIDTNKEIEKKEKEFTSQLEEMKKMFELKAADFYKELDELKVNSFKTVNDKFVGNLKKDNRGRKKDTNNSDKSDKVEEILPKNDEK